MIKKKYDFEVYEASRQIPKDIDVKNISYGYQHPLRRAYESITGLKDVEDSPYDQINAILNELGIADSFKPTFIQNRLNQFVGGWRYLILEQKRDVPIEIVKQHLELFDNYITKFDEENTKLFLEKIEELRSIKKREKANTLKLVITVILIFLSLMIFLRYF